MIRASLAVACAALLCLDLPAQRGGRFRSPSREAFAKAPLIAWQRNLEDALAEVATTGKPLLVCVNMEGEPASDQLAGRNYRNADFAALVSGFVPLIASPGRHTDADYDAAGRRIPCPRFGRVTCGEHVAIEPVLYRAYFDGERTAPRHVGVSPDGEILFDLYLLNRLRRIDEALEKHGKPGARGELASSADELPLNSPDASDRSKVEDAFLSMPESDRIALLHDLGEISVRHPELQRLAICSDSEQLQRAGIMSLAAAPSALTLTFFEKACDQAEELGGLEDLLASLQDLSADNEEARRIFRTRQGLYADSTLLSLASWREALTENPGEPSKILDRSELDNLDARLESLERRRLQFPGDGDIQIEIAATNMRYGQIQLATGHDPSLLFQDALLAAELAEKRGASRGQALSYQAWAQYMLGEVDAAGKAAEQALPELLASADSPLTAEILAIFATCRTRALYDAITRGTDWPAAWVADIHSSYRILSLHGARRVEQAAAHIDWLVFMSAFGQEGLAVERAMTNFPEDADIQECLRRRLLREEGPQGLIAGYERRPALPGKSGSHSWFAAYASLVAAERFVEAEQSVQAIQAYGHAIELFEKSVQIEVSFRDTANHFIALSLAGRARLEMGAKAYQAAVGDVCAALAKRPYSARSNDGLGNTPLGTARLLAEALADQSESDLSRSLQHQLSELGFDLEAGDGR